MDDIKLSVTLKLSNPNYQIPENEQFDFHFQNLKVLRIRLFGGRIF